MICEFHPEIVWKNWWLIVMDNTVSGLTNAGAFVLFGETVRPIMLKLLITTGSNYA